MHFAHEFGQPLAVVLEGLSLILILEQHTSQSVEPYLHDILLYCEGETEEAALVILVKVSGCNVDAGLEQM